MYKPIAAYLTESFLTLSQSQTHKCVHCLHKYIRIYMGVSILGVNIFLLSVGDTHGMKREADLPVGIWQHFY